MDVLRKMFSKSKDDRAEKKDEFRKPPWYDDTDTDDDDELFDGSRKFAFQMFTNPFELQKYFEHQMQEILKTLKECDENTAPFDRNLKDEYLKHGFEENFMKEFRERKGSVDTDLDGEIYADQLHSLLQRLSPEIKSIIPEKNKFKVSQPKLKLSDEEKIMATIHGTMEEEANEPIRRKEIHIPKLAPHFGGVFEGTYQGPKMFGQSIMTKIIRKPDGSYETQKIVRDTDGNIKTTITRSIDGKSETVTTYGKDGDEKSAVQLVPSPKCNASYVLPSDRNIYISQAGYALPKNLW